MNYLVLLPILVSAAGFYMIIRLKAFFIVHPIRSARKMLAAIKRDGNLSALTLALSGTLGVGNIIGVSLAVAIGGEGSVLWIFLSSLFSCIIKYSEVTISVDKGGAAELIRSSTGKLGDVVSTVYCAICLLLSLLMGSALQARCVGASISEGVGTSRSVVTLALIIVCFALLSGNSEKARNISVKMLPIATIVYIFLIFTVLFVNIERLPSALLRIITSAFSPKSMGGGIAGSAMLLSLREGYCAGMLSNEAGSGTSSLAHTLSSGVTPCECGLFGICEVFFDTTVLCSLTGLAIVVGVEDVGTYSSPMQLCIDAFSSSLGTVGILVLSALVFVFAVSTVLCWYYYGRVMLTHLFGNRLRSLYTILYFVFIPIGVYSSDGLLAYLSDSLLLLMAIPILFAVIKSSDRIISLSETLIARRERASDIKEDEYAKAARNRFSRASRKAHPRSHTR